jgi:hypothetical protein
MPGEEGPGGDVVGDTGRTPDFHCFSRSPFCASDDLWVVAVARLRAAGVARR